MMMVMVISMWQLNDDDDDGYYNDDGYDDSYFNVITWWWWWWLLYIGFRIQVVVAKVSNLYLLYTYLTLVAEGHNIIRKRKTDFKKYIY